jgi:protease IV
LVDKMGGLEDAINCAARMAKLKDYRLREYPEQQNWLNELLDRNKPDPVSHIKKEIGEENYRIYKEMVEIKQMTGSAQARLPFVFFLK